MTCEDGYISTYFDISQCEPRSIAYQSGDEQFRGIYENGLDPYMELAKLTWPDLYKSLPKDKFKEEWRSTAKQSLISICYNRGVESLAAGMEVSVETVKNVKKAMFDNWKEVDNLRRSMLQFAKFTGRCHTYLGDRLDCDKGRYFTTAVNYPNQGNSACILMEGFCNALRQIQKEGYEIYSETVIHDSNTNMIRIENLPEIDLIYRRYFRKYVREKFGADYKYDLDLLHNFADHSSWSMDIEKHEATISGTIEDVDYIWKHMSAKRDVTLISEEVDESDYNQFDDFIKRAMWRPHVVCSLPEFNPKGYKTIVFKINDKIKGEELVNEPVGEKSYFEHIKTWREHPIDYKLFNITKKEDIDEIEKENQAIGVKDNPLKVYPCEIADRIREAI